jgi:hypothetical protein
MTENASITLRLLASSSHTENTAWYRTQICSNLQGVPFRRLDDRIRELCARVITTPATELEPTISALKAALREHTERLRTLAAAKLVSIRDGQIKPPKSLKA